MIFMLDTANIAAIKKAVDLYPIEGVTTNPSIIAKEKRPLKEILFCLLYTSELPTSVTV